MALGAPWSRAPGYWELDGHPLRVQVPSTTGLAAVISLDDKAGAGLFTVVECTAPGDREWLIDRIITARTELGLLDDVADVLVERITGWKRWEAAHVWRHTLGSWPTIDGDLLGAGVDVTSLDPARATNTVYAWWRRNLQQDPDAWKQFRREMEKEPTRAIVREAEQPMDPAVYAQLSKKRPASSTPKVSASTITMPERLP